MFRYFSFVQNSVREKHRMKTLCREVTGDLMGSQGQYRKHTWKLVPHRHQGLCVSILPTKARKGPPEVLPVTFQIALSLAVA